MSKVYVFMGDMTADATLATNKREVHWKQNCLEGYHDPSLRETFTSKHQMRSWMAHHKMRDTGMLHNPNKALGGSEGAVNRLTGSTRRT